MTNLRHYSRPELEIICKEQKKLIAQLKNRSALTDFVRMLSRNEKLEQELLNAQAHNIRIYKKLQQHRLYLGNLDIVDFCKSVEEPAKYLKAEMSSNDNGDNF